MNDNGKTINILLVEDNPDDVELTREALREAKMATDLEVVSDGCKALDYLNRREPYQNSIRPDLVLLDLNLPRVDGREVLVQIKSDPELKTIPVVVLTTSGAEEDVQKAYDNYANCYITKPVDFDQFAKIVQAIECFWFTIVKLPEQGEG